MSRDASSIPEQLAAVQKVVAAHKADTLTLPALEAAAVVAWEQELVRLGALAGGMNARQGYELGFAAGGMHVAGLARKLVGDER